MSDRTPAPAAASPTASSPESLAGIAAEMREAVLDGTTRSRAWRAEQLEGVARMLLQNVSLWERALADDLGKGDLEAHMTEIGYTVAEARRARRSLRRWMAPTPVPAPLALQPAAARTVPEPLGAALVIAPWNYPLQLSLAPLIGALAAGDAAVLKPSEVAPATSRLLAQLVPAYLDPRAVRVVEGGADVTTALLAERWDLIFYTGNGTVGRIVAAAAAKHLTPTVLELGGKSPVYVHRSADIAAAARRIAWGKWLNAGQTCVAPDHVLVDREVADELVEELRRATAEQLREPRDSPTSAASSRSATPSACRGCSRAAPP
ncbi:aldehyde dehydrogenase family protein [Agrococcus sp. SL85]|uniref:aldehyde dehydrogenase family protein n=1 Tax=Agrococcus sp. SL85 TaxID=2995141 RepID=UPI00226CCEF1|nr:aldehyde dehydrogenase family protein [Agrococcus sp. SL85]WAC65602.1 aldehyde dehydrogenase family protein [Agrococcus sp. SL85]